MPRGDGARGSDLVESGYLPSSRDPLDRAAADPELLGDLVQTWAPRCSQRVTNATLQLGVDERATAVLAVSLGPSNARIHPLAAAGFS
jgi:hypothetical protein